MSRHIVLTRCNESDSQFEWLKDFVDNTTWTIYNKGNTPFGLPAQARPNVGRDGECQIWHIYNNYDNLPDELIFLQPRFDDHLDWVAWQGAFKQPTPNKLPDRILNHDYDGNELQFLSVPLTECWCPNDTTKHNMQTGIAQEDLTQLNDLVKSNYKLTDTWCWQFGGGMMYSIPKRLLVNKSKDWWRRCYEFYMSYPSPDHHCYIFERCYLELFNYSEY
jgi:hypothetical protein